MGLWHFLGKLFYTTFSNAKNWILVFFSSLEQWQSIQVAACDIFSMYCQVSLSFVNQHEHKRKLHKKEELQKVFSFYAINYNFSFQSIWRARFLPTIIIIFYVLRNPLFRATLDCVSSTLGKISAAVHKKSILPASQKGFVLLVSLLTRGNVFVVCSLCKALIVKRKLVVFQPSNDVFYKETICECFHLILFDHHFCFSLRPRVH